MWQMPIWPIGMPREPSVDHLPNGTHLEPIGTHLEPKWSGAA